MTRPICPHCDSSMVEYFGRVECDDDESLEIFCDQWLCNACGTTFIGDLADDDDDDPDDDYYDWWDDEEHDE